MVRPHMEYGMPAASPWMKKATTLQSTLRKFRIVRGQVHRGFRGGLAPTSPLCVPRRGIVEGPALAVWHPLPAALLVVSIVWVVRLLHGFCVMAVVHYLGGRPSVRRAHTSFLRKQGVSRGQLHCDALRTLCSSQRKRLTIDGIEHGGEVSKAGGHRSLVAVADFENGPQREHLVRKSTSSTGYGVVRPRPGDTHSLESPEKDNDEDLPRSVDETSVAVVSSSALAQEPNQRAAAARKLIEWRFTVAMLQCRHQVLQLFYKAFSMPDLSPRHPSSIVAAGPQLLIRQA
nr:unnamed protein product [Spirometra erinaceieuropaei]